MASVISLQMPEPPPVQSRTLPLKIPSLKTDNEDGGGGATTYGAGAMFSFRQTRFKTQGLMILYGVMTPAATTTWTVVGATYFFITISNNGLL